MKIHEKDPSSATAAAPPSPLKRRRLSSKRKLSHDTESEKEDPAPAKKVLSAPSTDVPAPGTLGRNPSSLYFRSLGLGGHPSQASNLCFPALFHKVSGEKSAWLLFLCGRKSPPLSPLMI